MRKKITIFFFAVVLVLGFSYWAYSAQKDDPRKKRNELYKQLELFSDALSLVENEYVETPKSKELIYGSLKGLLSSLDPFSEFLEPQRYEELRSDTEGRFGGLGIEITIKDGMLTVITPIEDTPAWKAGISPGDRIIKIDAQATKNITSTEAVKKLRGNPGTEVSLTLFREGLPKFIEVKLKRDIIQIKDIKNARILEDGIAYIRLTEFRENTARDMELALSKLKKEGMESLILDLRNNPGGLLDVAVQTAELFIPAGDLIVSIKGRKAAQNMEFKSGMGFKYSGLPLVALVNEGSASGSEIVAGALQDYKLAVIAGSRTFGKGSVQSILPLADGSALKLTTSKYFTPLGRTIHNEGIAPDVLVENEKMDLAMAGEIDIEAVFERLKDAQQGQEQSLEFKPQASFDYKEDAQILRCIDVIRGISVYKDFYEKEKAAGR